jgi:hypothetical protein
VVGVTYPLHFVLQLNKPQIENENEQNSGCLYVNVSGAFIRLRQQCLDKGWGWAE